MMQSCRMECPYEALANFTIWFRDRRTEWWRAPSSLHRNIPCQRNPMHTPPKPMIIINGVMQHLPIIPQRQTPRPPLEPARKLRSRLPLMQKLQQGLTLSFRPALESLRVRDVEIQSLLTCLGMRANCRVP